nr:glycosyltransferase [uncultured Gemmiger sp.]
MRVHLYTGSLDAVRRSGVGQAVAHQRAMLQSAGVEVTESWDGHADAVHINTVLPDAPFAALRARARGEKVVYYGHSTMQDFRDSFVGSNLLAPLFKRWLCLCYGLEDIVLTPTPYAKGILQTYGLPCPVRAMSNGVDTGFFAPDKTRGAAFRRKYGLTDDQKVVVSAGHFMQRKGLTEFIELARALPLVQFYWFGYTPPALVPAPVRRAMAAAPDNLHFPGFVSQAELRDAYCGADLFCFCSHEETEGIVVLEALACGVPVLLRDIPVYEGWLTDGVNVYKASDNAGFAAKAEGILTSTLPDVTAAGKAVAEARSLPRMGKALCGVYRDLCPA